MVSNANAELTNIWGRNKADLLKRDGVDSNVYLGEIQRLYVGEIMLHPYRWYSLMENYRSTYINTDEYGFRKNSPGVALAKTQVGFFGGSTGFSFFTDDAHSIPSLMEDEMTADSVSIPNFAVGGYSLSAELPTFIEVSRRTHMKTAIFYDGVNELSRYVEYLQDRLDAKYYETVGYPYYPSVQDALVNLGFSIPGGSAGSTEVQRRSRKKPNVTRESINRMINENNADAYAENIIRLYLENVRDLVALAQARKVFPIFLWQPDLFITKKPLSHAETLFRDRDPGYRILALKLHEKAASLSSRPEMKGVAYFDLSGVLDDLGPEAAFFDFCHLGNAGNQRVADAIVPILRTELQAKSRSTR